MTNDKLERVARAMYERDPTIASVADLMPLAAAAIAACEAEAGERDIEKPLSDGRANNPYEPFTDESGCWNEGFSTAWAIARAALNTTAGEGEVG